MYRIYLSEEDTADSIIERIKNSPESDICLVVFTKNHSVLSVVNLKLFKEAAASLGKTITVSTNDDAVKMVVEKAQVRLHIIPKQSVSYKNFNGSSMPGTSSGLAEREKINMKNYNNTQRSVDSIGFSKGSAGFSKSSAPGPIFPEPETSKFLYRSVMPNECAPKTKDDSKFNVSGANKNLFAIFVVLAVAIVGALVYIFVPTAQITVTPKTEPMNASFELVLDKNAAAVNKADKISPASVIVANVEKSGQFNATGKKEVTAKATGIVTIYNEWSSFPQSLVVSTRILAANGKLFRTTKTIVVPGFIRDENGNDVPGSIDVPVIAAEAGPDYNIDPTTFTLPAFKGTSKYQKIYAKSTEATAGGARGFATVVSALDLKKAKDYLADQAKKDLLSQLDDKRPSDLTLLPDAVNITSGDLETNVKVDQVVNNFKAKLKNSATAYLFNPSYVKEITNDIFATMGREKKASMISDSPDIEYADVSMLGTDKVKMTVSARTLAYSAVDMAKVKEKMLGKSTEEVGDYIRSNAPEIDKVKITLWPFWVKKVPTYERNVKMSLDIPSAK